MKGRLSALGGTVAVIAIVVAVWSTHRLKKTEQAVKRVLDPVPLSVPELFPSDALLYVEARGWETSWDRLDDAKKQVQNTAAYLMLSRKWNENRDAMPSGLRTPLETIEKELQHAEERFGYRPTTREFVETYGKHTAAALVPVAGKDRPAALLVIRLPDGGAAGMVQSKLGNAGGVKPCEPPQRRGFPMFREDVMDFGTVFYGVGRGHLVISDDGGSVERTLDRLADAADPESPRKPAGTMGEDAVLKRVAAPETDGAAFVLYLKRDQKFAGYDKSLEILDSGLKNAFALSPNDPAVAFAASGADARQTMTVRTSLVAPAPGPWEKALPSGAFQAQLPGTATSGQVREGREPALKRFFGKAIWGEIEALLSDPDRVRRLGQEAFGGGPAFDDDAIRRLPNDARLVAKALRSVIESASSVADPSAALVAKGYPAAEGVTMAEYAAGVDADEMAAFVLSGALDETAQRFPDWVRKETRGTASLWTLSLEKALNFAKKEAPAEAKEFVDSYMGSLEPSIVITGRRIFLVIGPHLRDEIVALNGGAGGKSLADDALFQEALARVPAVRTRLSFVRPAEKIEGMASIYRSIVPNIKKAIGEKEADGRDVLDALVKTADTLLGWTKEVRATVEWDEADETHPGGMIALVDPEAAKRSPEAALADATLAVPGMLPEETWFLQDSRVATGPTYDAVRKAFLDALPGGEERLKKMSKGSEEDREISDAVVDGLVRNVRGEAGVAIAFQEMTPEQLNLRGLQAQFLRFPAVIAFAEFENPDRAWAALKLLLQRVDKQINPRPYKERWEEYQKYGGEPPWLSELTTGALGKCPAMAIDVHFPYPEEHKYIIGSLLAVRREKLIFLTNSVWSARKVATLPKDGEGTLAKRLVWIPNQAVPTSAAELRLSNAAGWNQHARRNIDLQLEQLVPMSLRTAGGHPPEDRVKAHRWGWTKAINLVMDLFEDPGWEIQVTSRTKDSVKVERKFLQESPR